MNVKKKLYSSLLLTLEPESEASEEPEAEPEPEPETQTQLEPEVEAELEPLDYPEVGTTIMKPSADPPCHCMFGV